MADNQMVPVQMARLNITYNNMQGDLPDMVSYDLSDEEIKRIAAESIRDGYVPGIDAVPDPNFANFVVDRFPARDDIPFNRLSLRPKTEFGKKVTLSFKTPDVLDQVDEGDHAALRRWVEYGEYVHIEFDLGAKTARVMEVRAR